MTILDIHNVLIANFISCAQFCRYVNFLVKILLNN
jgi:hypothetical protein